MDTAQDRLQGQNLKVICGANVEHLEDCRGMTIEEVKNKMAGVMNISGDHNTVLINGKPLRNPAEYLLKGDEELEFKRLAGQKG